MSGRFLRSAHGLVDVEYGHFLVESRLPLPAAPVPAQDVGLSVSRGAVVVAAEGTVTRYALVQLEAWSAAPDGDGVAEQVVCFPDAFVRALGLSAERPGTAELDLGAPGTYRVRLHRWGADDRRHEEFPHAAIHRVEHVVLRFWPTDEEAEEVPADPFFRYQAAIREWAWEFTRRADPESP
ncbi:hypothetical protein GCM10022243_09380 [Saccharothrix violaceirubra]|uniref:Uncharacterized protein n=1 Tax=Saccharothrix violaceirubra TaxID=413306 RepID=A0A7W7T444_9PSEU|nr:hypothetical protein [Saccharothrix violaceirubra]MBB4966224.1 hypothetical protein [Saccharothrix violaceirubra]